MISEKIIAKEFNGLWEQALPLLTPNFVSLFNAAYSVDLTELPATRFRNIPVNPAIEKHDLVAELSFQLAKVAFIEQINAAQIKAGDAIFDLALSEAIKFLKRYRHIDSFDLLKPNEISEAINIACQYDHFLAHILGKEIEFSPAISGAGFLGLCYGDLSIDDTLYEIKAVSRNIAGKDIKQLILYLALQYSTGNKKWIYAGFFNPRKAIYYRFSIDHLIYRTSGGRSSPEVFIDITDYLSVRGIEIDAIF